MKADRCRFLLDFRFLGISAISQILIDYDESDAEVATFKKVFEKMLNSLLLL